MTDILLHRYQHGERVRITPSTIEGARWLRTNLEADTVASDGFEETEAKMIRDGLVVEWI